MGRAFQIRERVKTGLIDGLLLIFFCCVAAGAVAQISSPKPAARPLSQKTESGEPASKTGGRI